MNRPLFSNKMTSLMRIMEEVLLFSAMITHCCSLLWYWNDLQERGKMLMSTSLAGSWSSEWLPLVNFVTMLVQRSPWDKRVSTAITLMFLNFHTLPCQLGSITVMFLCLFLPYLCSVCPPSLSPSLPPSIPPSSFPSFF